jgi:hypothetical protein
MQWCGVGVVSCSGTSFTQGCDVACTSGSGFAAATQAAAAADVVVIIIGLDQSQESEGHDRDIIALPGMQAQLVAQVRLAAHSSEAGDTLTAGPGVGRWLRQPSRRLWWW